MSIILPMSYIEQVRADAKAAREREAKAARDAEYAEKVARVPAPDFKGGKNPDGSFTLCPEAYRALRELFLWRGHGHSIATHERRIQSLADEIYLHQGIDFEQYC